MSGDVHHSATGAGTDKDTDGSNDENGSELGGLGTYSGAEEVDGVVGDADGEVEGGQ